MSHLVKFLIFFRFLLRLIRLHARTHKHKSHNVCCSRSIYSLRSIWNENHKLNLTVACMAWNGFVLQFVWCAVLFFSFWIETIVCIFPFLIRRSIHKNHHIFNHRVCLYVYGTCFTAIKWLSPHHNSSAENIFLKRTKAKNENKEQVTAELQSIERKCICLSTRSFIWSLWSWSIWYGVHTKQPFKFLFRI